MVEAVDVVLVHTFQRLLLQMLRELIEALDAEGAKWPLVEDPLAVERQRRASVGAATAGRGRQRSGVSVRAASARLDDLLAAPGLKQTVDHAAACSGRLRKLADEGELDRLVKHISDTAERLDAMIGDKPYDVRVIVQELRTTADNLRILSEHLKRHPAGALIGGPLEKMQVPGKSP